MENKLSPKELATRIKLYDSGGGVRKRSFVEYYAFNPISSEYPRIRFYKGINDHRNLSDRYEVAKKALAKIKRKIKAGWSLFVEREKKALLRRKKKRELSIAEHLEMVFQASIPNLKSKSISDYRVILKSFSSWMSRRGLDDLQILAFSQQLARE
ncbi:MAG: hypothetical protein AAFU64_07070 [Bacteroidota bacterium]